MNDLGNPPWRKAKGSESLNPMFLGWLWSNMAEKNRLNLFNPLGLLYGWCHIAIMHIFLKQSSQFHVILKIWGHIGIEYFFTYEVVTIPLLNTWLHKYPVWFFLMIKQSSFINYILKYWFFPYVFEWYGKSSQEKGQGLRKFEPYDFGIDYGPIFLKNMGFKLSNPLGFLWITAG